MADNFAMGNALMAFGQTAGNAVNNYFNEQIGAAQHAQETTLKQMQLQAERDDRQQALHETNRHNTADEANAAAKQAAEEHYQGGLLQNDTTKTANTAEYQKGELGIRGGELANQQANTASEISHRSAEEKEADARLAQEGGKGSNAALIAGEKLQSEQLKGLQEQLKKNNPDGSATLTSDQQKTQDGIQKQITAKESELAHSRAELTRAGKLNAPMGSADANAPGTSKEFGDAATDFAPKVSPKGKPVEINIGAIPPGAVNYLKSNPSTAVRAQFEQKYGKGSSTQILGE